MKKSAINKKLLLKVSVLVVFLGIIILGVKNIIFKDDKSIINSNVLNLKEGSYTYTLTKKSTIGSGLIALELKSNNDVDTKYKLFAKKSAYGALSIAYSAENGNTTYGRIEANSTKTIYLYINSDSVEALDINDIFLVVGADINEPFSNISVTKSNDNYTEITRSKSINNDVSLYLKSITSTYFDIDFDPSTTSYKTSTNSNGSNLTATSEDPNAIVEVCLFESCQSGEGAATNGSSFTGTLTHTYTINVKNTNGAKKTYTVVVNKGSDATLKSITSEAPGFNNINITSDKTNYTAETTQPGLSITATSTDPSATVKICVNGNKSNCKSGTGSVSHGEQFANLDSITFSITVTNESEEKNYTLVVNKTVEKEEKKDATLKSITSEAPGFNNINITSDKTNYTAETTQPGLSITATSTDPSATVKICVNGNKSNCKSGIGSVSHGEQFGNLDSITFSITVTNESEKKDYTLVVNRIVEEEEERDTTLKSLTSPTNLFKIPNFDSNKTEYSIDALENSGKILAVATDSNATIMICDQENKSCKSNKGSVEYTIEKIDKNSKYTIKVTNGNFNKIYNLTLNYISSNNHSEEVKDNNTNKNENNNTQNNTQNKQNEKIENPKTGVVNIISIIFVLGGCLILYKFIAKKITFKI